MRRALIFLCRTYSKLASRSLRRFICVSSKMRRNSSQHGQPHDCELGSSFRGHMARLWWLSLSHKSPALVCLSHCQIRHGEAQRGCQEVLPVHNSLSKRGNQPLFVTEWPCEKRWYILPSALSIYTAEGGWLGGIRMGKEAATSKWLLVVFTIVNRSWQRVNERSNLLIKGKPSSLQTDNCYVSCLKHYISV